MRDPIQKFRQSSNVFEKPGILSVKFERNFHTSAWLFFCKFAAYF